MSLTIAIACAVHARTGDIVHVFFLGAGSKRGLAAKVRDALAASPPRVSPLVFNETAGAWFMIADHAVGPGARGVGESMHYLAAPDPSLPIERAVRGTVLETRTVQDMTYNHLDTLVTIDVLEDRPVAPGQPWFTEA